jgi:hypothetical protein
MGLLFFILDGYEVWIQQVEWHFNWAKLGSQEGRH